MMLKEVSRQAEPVTPIIFPRINPVFESYMASRATYTTWASRSDIEPPELRALKRSMNDELGTIREHNGGLYPPLFELTGWEPPWLTRRAHQVQKTLFEQESDSYGNLAQLRRRIGELTQFYKVTLHSSDTDARAQAYEKIRNDGELIEYFLECYLYLPATWKVEANDGLQTRPILASYSPPRFTKEDPRAHSTFFSNDQNDPYQLESISFPHDQEDEIRLVLETLGLETEAHSIKFRSGTKVGGGLLYIAEGEWNPFVIEGNNDYTVEQTLAQLLIRLHETGHAVAAYKRAPLDYFMLSENAFIELDSLFLEHLFFLPQLLESLYSPTAFGGKSISEVREYGKRYCQRRLRTFAAYLELDSVLAKKRKQYLDNPLLMSDAWKDIQRKYLGIVPDEKLDFSFIISAGSYFFFRPFYLRSYFISELTARFLTKEVEKYLSESHKKVESSEFKKWMNTLWTQLFQAGPFLTRQYIDQLFGTNLPKVLRKELQENDLFVYS